MILLKHEGFELGLAPDSGGTVTHFRHHGDDLLRPAQGDAPTQAAAFPMVPFSGRIARGRFNWHGRPVQLEANFPPEPHAIHGHGWTRRWEVVAQAQDRATLCYTHAADAWPWSYRAEQAFRLGPGGLDLVLSLTNLSSETMPAGLGWHPYFPASGAEIEADTSMIWETGADGIPAARRAPVGTEQLRRGQVVENLALDTPFETAGGPLILRWPAWRTMLRIQASDALRFLVVYTPPGESYFCAEPVSHVPDMVNNAAPPSETGLVALAPGETLSGSIRLELLPAHADSSAAATRRAPAR